MRDHVGQQDHPCIQSGGQVRRDQRRRIDYLRRPFFLRGGGGSMVTLSIADPDGAGTKIAVDTRW